MKKRSTTLALIVVALAHLAAGCSSPCEAAAENYCECCHGDAQCGGRAGEIASQIESDPNAREYCPRVAEASCAEVRAAFCPGGGSGNDSYYRSPDGSQYVGDGYYYDSDTGVSVVPGEGISY
jgi:hypothetical protein